ncbi:LysR family transcriptional regulator [Bradyrhizobium sp. STM 3809]|uniref:LysR family transcriptional regulator n=1 Tax=Bradyrhizobium sp. STM 3809 TaxID=551936 RepID=UPI0002406B6B|nr:LysR family transcriptional regulator [Bradyrhizobium sp. STM 3809]CCD99648.1 RuBisCO operon transcriptional regulator [Bradyrhizobium sp. STM 3809]
MHITLQHLRIFEAVGRHGAITRAAHELHLTQPAVSMQCKQLEDQIGLPLIEQIGKKLQLTEAGRELLVHAQRIAAGMSDLKAAMDQFRGLERGVLRLAVVSTANYFLPPVIAAFTQRHPGVRVSLRVVNRDAALAALADHHADLAITGQPPDSADIIAHHFMDNPLVVVAPPGHRLAGRGEIDITTLADETLVLREPGSGTRATVERYLAEHQVSYRPGCELSTNEALKQAVQAGLGLGIVPAQTVELEIETRRLVVLHVKGFPLYRRWFLLHRKEKRLSGAAEAFRSLLVREG